MDRVGISRIDLELSSLLQYKSNWIQLIYFWLYLGEDHPCEWVWMQCILEVVSDGRIHRGKDLLHCCSATGREGLSQFICLPVPEDWILRKEKADKCDCAKNCVSALTQSCFTSLPACPAWSTCPCCLALSLSTALVLSVGEIKVIALSCPLFFNELF